jgi:hypothetical protein
MAAKSLVLLLLLLPLCVMCGMCAAPGLSRVGQKAASDSTMSTAESFTLLLLLLLLLLLQGVGGSWPQQGGATGSIRLNPEIRHGANAGQCCSNRQRTVGSLCTLLPLHLNTHSNLHCCCCHCCGPSLKPTIPSQFPCFQSRLCSCFRPVNFFGTCQSTLLVRLRVSLVLPYRLTLRLPAIPVTPPAASKAFRLPWT